MERQVHKPKTSKNRPKTSPERQKTPKMDVPFSWCTRIPSVSLDHIPQNTCNTLPATDWEGMTTRTELDHSYPVQPSQIRSVWSVTREGVCSDIGALLRVIRLRTHERELVSSSAVGVWGRLKDAEGNADGKDDARLMDEEREFSRFAPNESSSGKHMRLKIILLPQ